MLILRQVIGYQAGKRTATLANADPELTRQLQETKQQLNSILNKWKFGDQPIKTSAEFLTKFGGWIEAQLAEQKELKDFLARKGLTDLKEANTKLTNRELGAGEELEKVRQELTEKEQTWNNTEADYLRQIEELKNQATSDLTERQQEKLAEYDNLEVERDEAIREKRALEQEFLATNNRLNLKQQEVANKEQTIERLKKEASEKEKALNEKLKELKKKYSKQAQLLDQEQLENNKLLEKIESLEAEIQQFKGGAT